MRLRADAARRTPRLILPAVALALCAGLVVGSPVGTAPAAADHCRWVAVPNMNGNVGGAEGHWVCDDGGQHDDGGSEEGTGSADEPEWGDPCAVFSGTNPDGSTWGFGPAEPCEEVVAEIDFVPPTVIRDRVSASIEIADPVVGSNPPFDEPGRFGAVGVPTWLWIDTSWEPIGPVSDASGPLTVAVMASPRRVTWQVGDGSAPVVCDGPGVPWSRDRAEGGTGCSHTYTSSSADQPGEAYALSATVTWVFEWWINGIPQGEFGTYLASTDFDYQVGEIQGIETSR
jgi:hypothetical protein